MPSSRTPAPPRTLSPANRPEAGHDPRPPAVAYGLAVAAVALATGLTRLAHPLLALADLSMLYLLVMIVVAVRLGRGPSIVASALSVAAFDFFFVPPHYTFAVFDARHTLTFAMMFGVGQVISALTLRIQRQEREARDREARTASLYALSRALGAAVDEAQTAEALAGHAAEVLGAPAGVVLASEARAPSLTASAGEVPFDEPEQAAARAVLDSGQPAGAGTATLPEARITCIPVRAGPRVAGALALSHARALDREARDLLEAFVCQGALALERANLAGRARASELQAREEAMRSALLSAVSHDLRTPLAAITGAATTLRDDAAAVPAEEQRGLVAAICDEAERMERLITNLLDMTRLESGGLRVKREWVPLEEMVGSALARLEPRLQGRPLKVSLPEGLPLLSADPLLIEQVLVNLLENAAKYSRGGSPIEVRARAAGEDVVVEVADRGPGVPEASRERVFEKFYRGAHVGVGGIGLGLPICKGAVEAHGGTISVEGREGGGAVFRVTLPAVAGPPSVNAEATP